MKRYKYFILENNRIDTTELEQKDFEMLLEKYCTQFSFDDKPIYRGVDLKSKYYKIDPKLYTRKSRNTQNYYTLLMSEWKNIPPRNKSMICTFEKRLSSGYGDVFRVIPFDNSYWGISKTWIKTIYNGLNLIDFNDSLYDFGVSKGILLKDDNYDEFMNQLQNFTGDDYLNFLSKSEQSYFLRNDMKGKRLDIAIKELIVPNENIKSCSYNELLKLEYNPVELWTDSICLLQKIK
jgi:hypothetical protein